MGVRLRGKDSEISFFVILSTDDAAADA